MKLLVVVVVVLLHELLATVALNDEQLDDLWKRFKTTHNKQYVDDTEEAHRRQVFAVNVESVTLHNIEADLGQHSFTLGINEYSDLTQEEFESQFLGCRAEHLNDTRLNDVSVDVSDLESLQPTVDWRTQGFVTPVKNQLQCGSCWAFSATGALEGQHFKNTRRLVSLSEQNLVDCSRNFGNYGCSGGMPSRAYQYIIANRGIDTESSYRYEARDGPCRFIRSGVGASCTNYAQLKAGDESVLKAAVARFGPISVCIDAHLTSFRQYRSGVYNDPRCTTTIDHCVLIVGYGTENGQDYWLAKNSWGTSWGLNGYILMARNHGNQCGIANYATFPLGVTSSSQLDSHL